MTPHPLSVDKVLWIKPGQGIAASGRIPEESEFFKDHFPGFPILPGVLAIEMIKQTAECYLRAVSRLGKYHLSLKQIRGVKFSNYLKPGDEWEAHLELASEEKGQTHWNGRLLHDGKAAVTAQLILEQTLIPESIYIS